MRVKPLGDAATGVALNVDLQILSIFPASRPAGYLEAHYGVTSLVDLGRPATMGQADAAPRGAFERLSSARRERASESGRPVALPEG